MAASKEDIIRWLDNVPENCTHMIVMCDTYDYEDYPIYVLKGEDPREVAKRPGEMQSVMECYSLSLDIEDQLREHRAKHWD